MRPDDLSEFSYGYAVTEELVHKSRRFMVDAPYFPSLRKEGQAGGGYDLRLDRRGVPLFIQFKLSDCMKRSRNMAEKAAISNNPIYRMHIRNYSKQHDLLLKLEQESESAKIFYVAPAFYTSNELSNAYFGQRVLKTSLFLKPRQIGKLKEGKKYHVSFHDPKGQFYIFSQPDKEHEQIGITLGRESSQSDLVLSTKRRSKAEPTFDVERSGKFLTSNDFEEDIANAMIQDTSSSLSADHIDKMFQEMLSLITDCTDIEKDAVLSRLEQSSGFQRVAYMARNFFGCETLIARPQDT